METIENAIATKADIINLRYEFKMGIADLKHELKANIAERHTHFADIESHLKVRSWLLGFSLVGISTLLFKSFFG